MVCVGAVLSLMEGPTGCDLANCVSQVGRVYRLLEMATEGCPGHGPMHFLVAGACGVGLQWDPFRVGWSRLGLLVLSNLSGPVQHFKAAILDAWRGKVAAVFCSREGFPRVAAA